MSDRKKVAIVTGASLGIGYSLAKELTKRGYQVYAGARRVAKMELLKEHGVITFELDVLDNESVKRAKRFILDNAGDKVDVLYNNAGASCLFPCTDISDADALACYEVNVFGPMRMVREFGPLVINAQGVIAFTSSVTLLIPFPFSSVYNSLKAAISQYSATLRLEMKPFNVKVLSVITGGVDTDIADTRPLPNDSLYNTPDVLQLFEERKYMAKRNKPQTPDEYAVRVCNDLAKTTSTTSPLYRYHGYMAGILGHILDWCPRWIVENAILKHFKLVTGFNKLYEKYVVKGNKAN